MEPAEYDFMFQLEDHLWWYVGMRRIVGRLIEDVFRPNTDGVRVLDAGAGTGGSLAKLREYGQVTAFDFSPRAAQLYSRRERGRVAVASIDAMPFADGVFDLATSFEVICQLDPPGEETSLHELNRVLKAGGGLVLRLPAFQWLYGPHDVAVHTRRRYSAEEIRSRLEKAGFEVLRITYANTLLFPVAVAQRLLRRVFNRDAVPESDVRPVPAPLNRVLTTVLSAEAPIIARTGLPVGLSIIALARKP